MKFEEILPLMHEGKCAHIKDNFEHFYWPWLPISCLTKKDNRLFWSLFGSDYYSIIEKITLNKCLYMPMDARISDKWEIYEF